MTTEQPVFVFGPGAWHGPECFQLVQDRLEAKGYTTRGVAYPSVGAEPPNKGLADDAAALRAEILAWAEQGRQVIVCVHSYGGMVGGEATKDLGFKQRKAQGKAGGVTLLVYLAAFAAPIGSTIFGMLGGNPLPWMDIEDGKVSVKNPEEVFYHDVPADLTKEAVAKLKHHCAAAFNDPITHHPWENMDCMYMYCDDDRALLPAVQRKMGPSLGEKGIFWTFNGSHSPFLSEPDNVVEGLLYGAQEVSKRL